MRVLAKVISRPGFSMEPPPIPAAMGFYLFLVFVVFFPCLFLGQAYFDGDLMQSFTLFQGFHRQMLLHGHVPLWNPFLFGGQPFFADPYSMSCYPLLYPLLLFPLPTGHGVFSAVHFFLALLGMHLWLRSLGLSGKACFIGALSFGFSGFFWTEIIHPLVMAMFAWTPWFFWSLERLIQTPKASKAFGAGLVFALLFLVGHYQVTLGVIYVGAAYFIFRAFQSYRRSKWRIDDQLKRTAVLILVFLFASSPLWGLWVPSYEYYLQSNRHDVNHLDYQAFNADLSLEFSGMRQFFWPDSPFDPSKKSIKDFRDFQANEGYAGIWAPFFLLWAFRKKFQNLALFSIAVVLAAVLIALGKNFPFHEFCCHWLPGFNAMRAVSRFIFIYALFTPVLVAIGLENFLEACQKTGRKVMIYSFFYAAAMAGLGFFLAKEFSPQLLFLVLGLIGFLALVVVKRSLRDKYFIASFAIGFMVNAMLLCSSRLGPVSNFDFEKNRPELTELKKQVGHSRIYIRTDIPYPIKTWWGSTTIPLPVNAYWQSGIKNIGGFNGISLSKFEKLRCVPFETCAQLLAVKGFVASNDLGLVPGYERVDWGPQRVYWSTQERPFVFCPSKAFVFPDDGTALKAMGQVDFKAYDHILFSSRPANGKGAQKVNCSYEWVLDEPDRETFKVQLDKSDWVIFSEVNFTGWKAWIDGRESPIATADTFLRALYLPAGDHQVVFRYDPFWFSWLEGGVVFWLVGLLFFLRFRKKMDSFF